MNTILLCFLTIFMTEYCYNSLHYYLLVYFFFPFLVYSLNCIGLCQLSSFLKLYWFSTVPVFWIFLFTCPISLMGVTHGTLLSSSPTQDFNLAIFLLPPQLSAYSPERQEPLKLHLFISFSFFQLEFSLHRPGWPGTCYIARPALKSLASLP